MTITLSTARPARGPGSRRGHTQSIDERIGANLRRVRIQRGLTQTAMADLIGVTYQQAHKYEKGINRIAASRLYQIAEALGCDYAVFFEGLEAPTTDLPRQGQTRELMDGFGRLSPRYQDTVLYLVRLLNDGKGLGDR